MIWGGGGEETIARRTSGSKHIYIHQKSQCLLNNNIIIIINRDAGSRQHHTVSLGGQTGYPSETMHIAWHALEGSIYPTAIGRSSCWTARPANTMMRGPTNLWGCSVMHKLRYGSRNTVQRNNTGCSGKLLGKDPILNFAGIRLPLIILFWVIFGAGKRSQKR